MRSASECPLTRQPQLEGMARNNWFTPDDLFTEISNKYGPFDLDAAADATNTKCARFYTEQDDALTKPWVGRVWCNPPYKDLIRWVTKAHEETRSGRAEIVVLLLPAHTSTAWFHDIALPHAELYWVRGKRKFGGAKDTSLMPSVAVVFRKPASPTKGGGSDSDAGLIR